MVSCIFWVMILCSSWNLFLFFINNTLSYRNNTWRSQYVADLASEWFLKQSRKCLYSRNVYWSIHFYWTENSKLLLIIILSYFVLCGCTVPRTMGSYLDVTLVLLYKNNNNKTVYIMFMTMIRRFHFLWRENLELQLFLHLARAFHLRFLHLKFLLDMIAHTHSRLPAFWCEN